MPPQPRTIYLVLLTLLLLLPHPATARQLWPNDPFHFFSLDLRPVQATLVHPNRRDSGVTIDIPRAWITFADGYDPLAIDAVPDRITTAALSFTLSDPDGQALSLRALDDATRTHIGLEAAIARLRPDQYIVALQKFAPPIATAERWLQRFGNRPTQQQDGLRYDKVHGAYFLPIGNDNQAEAQCTGSPNPVTFCNYTLWLNPDISAKITFLDFRFHGGPDVAIARLRRALAVLCRQSKPLCTPQG